MGIQFRCPNCKVAFRTEDQYAGTTTKCPRCKTEFNIPTQTAAKPEDKPPTKQQPIIPDMRVLLVDDSRTMRNIWKTILVQTGNIETVEAADGVQALAAIQAAACPFDLILLDWNMPEMDGMTCLTNIRQNDKTTPIIMVTTESEKHQIVTALKKGANNYVIKPFDPDTLLAKIDETMKKTAPEVASPA